MKEADKQIMGTVHDCMQGLSCSYSTVSRTKQSIPANTASTRVPQTCLDFNSPLYVPLWHSFLCHRLLMWPQDGFFGHCNTGGIDLGSHRQSWVSFYTKTSTMATYWGGLWERRGSLCGKNNQLNSVEKQVSRPGEGWWFPLDFSVVPQETFISYALCWYKNSIVMSYLKKTPNQT